MENKTVQYKRTLRGSVGAGMSALMNGSGRRFYILEHKDASKYHKAGESQKIIIDQVELGRGSDCQIRFDETFETVSRRHAAIVRENDRWKLVQLSTTNSTFLNGKKVETEWYLENGDEIQLAVNGPRLGFIVPAGKQSLVSSIKMTERLELFRKQALAPYKRAIACLAILIVLLSAGAGYVIYDQGQTIGQLLKSKDAQDKIIASLFEKSKRDSIKVANIKPVTVKHVTVVQPKGDISDVIDKIKPSVYSVRTTVHFVVTSTQKQWTAKLSGTGFLLEDGRFVTARHCIEPWMFDVEDMQKAYAYSKACPGQYEIYADIYAVNQNGDTFHFKSSDFRVDRSGDIPFEVLDTLNGENITLPGSIAFGGSKSSLGNDWAYVKTSKVGKIKNGASLSTSLKGGTSLHILGFPKNLGVSDGTKIVNPIYNSMSVSRDGLNDARCIMISQGVDHGNSGGPGIIVKNNTAFAVGIVSRGDSKSDFYNHLVPLSNLK